MKHIALILLAAFTLSGFASNMNDTTIVKENITKDNGVVKIVTVVTDSVNVNEEVITVNENGAKTEVSIGKDKIIHVKDGQDTVFIKLGKKVMRVVDNQEGPYVSFEEVDGGEEKGWKIDKDFKVERKKSEKKKKSRKKFEGHYGFIEIGSNSLTTPDYSMYPNDKNFLDLNHGKSIEFNLNFSKSISLQKYRNNIGLVTGIGFNWNNYKFDKDVTLEMDKTKDIVVPKYLPSDQYPKLEKTKLASTYLNVPVMLEFQIPTNDEPVYFSAGVIGGLKLGSRTKFKYNGNVSKTKDDFYLEPFRYGYTARVGYGSFYIYGTYYETPLFKEGRGPLTQPFTIGIGLSDS